MSKEFTVFVIDPAATTSPGIQLWYDHCTSLLLKNRKVDRIGVVFDGELHYKEEQFTYSDFQCYTKLITKVDSSSSNIHDSVYEGLDAFKTKINLAFVRNVIVITNEFPPGFSADRLNFIHNHGIKVYIVSPNDPNIPEFTYVSSALDVSKSSTLKKVQSRPTYSGCLRFGKGPEEDSEDHISIDVNVFAAVKKESFISGHTYIVEDNKVVQVKPSLKYFVKKYVQKETGSDNEDAEEFEKEEVEKSTKGFKYSKRDFVAITPELESVAKLKTSAGIDILGVIKSTNFPYTYYMNESQYVLPPGDSPKNLLSYTSFVKALYDLGLFALVRFVPSNMAEVHNSVLIPQLFATNSTDEKFSYGLFMIRIPFKEDEKMGRFSDLKQPDEEINSLMESFIQSKDLDVESNSSTFVNNPKLNLTETQMINLPRPKGNASTDSRLMVSSPSIFKFNSYLKKLLVNSLEYPSLLEYLERDDVISTLTTDETNLYTLENVLQYNSTNEERGWLKRKSSIGIAKELVEKLEVKLVVPTKKAKKGVLEGGVEVKLEGFVDPLDF